MTMTQTSIQLPGPSNAKLRRTLRILKFIFRPIDYLNNNAKSYGDIYQLGGETTPRTIVLSNPQAIKQILTAPPEHFEVGKGNQLLSFLMGDNSLLLFDGEIHQQRRKLLMPAFHGEYLQAYSQIIYEIAERVTSQWQIGKPFTVRLYTQEITLRVILQAVFGLDRHSQRYEELRVAISSLLDTISSPLTSNVIFFSFLQKDWGEWSPWGRFLRLKQKIRQLLYAEIKERREQNRTGRSIA